jgi:EamA domain-containing membrane protein RarD
MIKKQIVLHWLPTAFCAFAVYIAMRQTSRVDALQGLVLWLPMCFYFVAMISYSMQKQIRTLQEEIRELKKET